MDHPKRRLLHQRPAAPLAVVALTLALAVVSLPVVVVASGPAAAISPAKNSACHVPAGATGVTASPVPGSPSDWTLTSFDGVKIRLHWFPVAGATSTHPAPTILMGPGWGQSGDTDTTGTTSGLFDFVTIPELWNDGYNVLTWDPRGFGRSGGSAQVDSPTVEGRDMELIISWVATRPGVRLDRPGEPRLGMVGVSYGAGIQLTTAAVDCRVDAIVPTWSWHSLSTSLDKGNITKNGWSGLLYSALAGRPIDPHLARAHQESLSTGLIDPTEAAWFAQRGPGQLVGRIRAPTLFIQGEEDNLFTLDEAIANYRILRDRNVPTAMIWMCGGHGVCLTNPGNTQLLARTLAWLDRYVKGDRHVDVGPRFTFLDQNGASHSASDYPLPTLPLITADGHGTLQLTAAGGSGSAHPTTTGSDPLGSLAGPVTPAKATHAVNVGVPVGSRSGLVVGAPRLNLTYRGTTPGGTAPTRVFAQIVDDKSALVLDNQITPIVVTLDGRWHTTTANLETVVYHAVNDGHLTLQLVATTVAYAQPRLGGTIQFGQIHLALPGIPDPAPSALVDPPVHDTAATAPIIAALTTKGTVVAKEGRLNGPWVTEKTVTFRIAVAGDPKHGPLIVALTTNGMVLAKEGSLDAPWVNEETGIFQVAAASDPKHGPLIVALTTNGTVLAKEGSLNAPWVNEETGISQVAAASDAAHGPLIAALTTNGTVLAKEGRLNAPWATEDTGISQVAVASDITHGPLIAALTTGSHPVATAALFCINGAGQFVYCSDLPGGTGTLVAKEGRLNSPWVSEDTGISQVSVASDPAHGPLIAALKTNGTAVAKEGRLKAPWVTEDTGISQVAVASDPAHGPLIAALTTNGTVVAKEGRLKAPWVTEDTGISQVAVRG